MGPKNGSNGSSKPNNRLSQILSVKLNLNSFIRKSAFFSLILGLLAGVCLFSWSLLSDWNEVSKRVLAENQQTLELLLPIYVDLDNDNQTERLNAALTRLLEHSAFNRVLLQRGAEPAYAASLPKKITVRPILDLLSPQLIELQVTDISGGKDQAPMRLSATLQAHHAFEPFVARQWQRARMGLTRTLIIILIVILTFEFIAIRPMRALGQRLARDGSELSFLPEDIRGEAAEIKQLTRAFNQRVENIFRLQHENQSLVAALRASPDCCLIIDLESGLVLFSNAAAEQLLGRTKAECETKPIWDLWNRGRAEFESDAKAAQQMLGQSFRFIIEPDRPDETRITIEAHMTTFNLDGELRGLIFARDISERGALLQRVADNQKVKAIRTLAGGLAHDLNNRIQIAAGHLDLIDAEQLSAPHQQSLLTARQAILRSAQPIDQLLRYSEQKALATSPLNLSICLEGHRDMLAQAAAPCQLDLEIQDRAVIVDTNQAALLASLVQLLINASEAAELGQEPIHLLLDHRTLEAPLAGPLQTIPAGQYARLAITDQGRGIPEGNASRIFDPFFSTKALEQGGGMGLSVVAGFVQETASYISVQSEQGQGTTFTLLLPEAEPTVSAA